MNIEVAPLHPDFAECNKILYNRTPRALSLGPCAFPIDTQGPLPYTRLAKRLHC